MATWTLIAGRSAKSVQAATESAPTAAGDGILLDDVSGFYVVAECDSGQTFNAATGSLDAYVYDGKIGSWARSPELDLTFPAAASGLRRIAYTGFTVASPRARIAHVANAAPVSSGGITLYYLTTSLKGESN